MKTLRIPALLVVLLSATALFGAPFTIGSMDSGDCYPFMCNDSGTNVGPSINIRKLTTPAISLEQSALVHFSSNFGPMEVLR